MSCEIIGLFTAHAKANEMSEYTLDSYESDLNAFAAYTKAKMKCNDEGLDRMILASSPEFIVGYIQDLQFMSYKPSSIARKVACLRTFFSFCVKQNHGMLTVNPMANVHAPKVPKGDIKAMTEEQWTALVQSMSSDKFETRRDKLAVNLIATCGLKISEVVDLEVDDFSTVFDKVTIRRGDSATVFVLPEALQQEISDYLRIREKLARTNKLIINKLGEQITTRSIRRKLEWYGNRAGINPTRLASLLRNKFAKDKMIEGKMSRKEIVTIMGLKGGSCLLGSEPVKAVAA